VNVIDLRSDTVTKPSPEMLRAMVAAEVGDDVLDGDPTTRRLENRVADLLGMEAALFFPSGTQANQTAVWLQAERGTEIVLERQAHLADYEMAALAALSGVQIRPVTSPDGVLTAELVREAWRSESRYTPRISLLAAENTHNAAGGKVLPLKAWDGLVAEARSRGVPLHLDGARIWHAAVALDVPVARIARGASSVMVSLSKGLGCPVGSCLAGSAELIGRAWEVRKRLGGGMRQTGFLAAAGLYALEHNLDRLAEDHEKAVLLAEQLTGHPAVHPLPPESNILMLDLLKPGAAAADVVERLAARGVQLVRFSDRRLRAVTHLDVSRDDVLRAAQVIAAVLDD
jgi:threonine aldolase